MKKSYSYHDCYKVLGIKPESNWSELRNAYKKSIQKWHPDRFKDETPEKLAAEHKIKVINIAYNQIHQYYRDNSSLPPLDEINKEDTIVDATKKTTSRKASVTDTQIKTHSERKSIIKDKRKNSSKRFITFIVLISLFPSYYFYMDISNVENQFDTNNRSKEINTQNNTLPQMTKETISKPNYLPDNISQKSQKNIDSTDNISTHESLIIRGGYFTNGSTFSDVIDTQGAPTSTVGDIWFYGQSEVHFKDGKVSHWVRTTKTPLRAHMTIDR